MTTVETKETWRDWMHPDTPEPEPLLTRAQFVDRLQAEGVDVSERTLAHWENKDILPRAIRRWRDGGPKALYPEWLLPAVNTIRIMQDMGESLAEIRATIHSIYRLPLSEDEQIARNTAYDATVKALNGPIFALARQWEQWARDDIESLEIVIRGANGSASTLDFSIAMRSRRHAKTEINT